MKKILSAVAAFTLMGSFAVASDIHWEYSGEVGPEHWGSLEPAFAMCSKGVNQAPVDLAGFMEAELAPITFTYFGLATEILNNGHAIQANYAAGSTITIEDKTFELKQFNFHSPSENTLNGESFPMEGHFVHSDSQGNFAIIGVFFTIGEENQAMKKLWKQMPASQGDKAGLASQVRAEELMPENRDYYRFNGSLTTPPCSEGVTWIVMKNPVTVSDAQVKQFTEVMGHPNNRPVQPVNSRPLLQ